MNEEIQNYMNRVLKQIEEWDYEHTLMIAMDLNLNLTVMKLLLGAERFDELPAFTRYLRETTQYLESLEKKDKR